MLSFIKALSGIKQIALGVSILIAMIGGFYTWLAVHDHYVRKDAESKAFALVMKKINQSTVKTEGDLQNEANKVKAHISKLSDDELNRMLGIEPSKSSENSDSTTVHTEPPATEDNGVGQVNINKDEPTVPTIITGDQVGGGEASGELQEIQCKIEDLILLKIAYPLVMEEEWFCDIVNDKYVWTH